MKRDLRFSIILPVWHGGGFLEDALDSSRHLDFPPDRFEVIVAGEEADVASQRIVEAAKERSAVPIRFVGCSGTRRSKMLNAACDAATGQILVFADDDCVFREMWLRNLDEVIRREPSFGMIGGEEELDSDNSPFDLALDYVLKSFIGTGGVRKGSGPLTREYYPRLWNMAVPRDVALEVASNIAGKPPQIFDESLDAHEDVDLGKRIAGIKRHVVYAPEIRVGHRRAATIWRFFRRNFNNARVSRSLGVHRLPHLALAAFTLLLPALFLASRFSPLSGYLLVAILGAYCTLLLAAGLRGFLHSRRLSVLAIVPVLLVTLHLARGIGYLFPLPNWQQETT
jgi:GT2 family glycosyltransferase